MLYFPSSNDNEEKLGTCFWSSKINNFQNIHQNNEKEFKFKEKNELIHKTNFDKNNLYGFVKNNKSWHSVDEIEMQDDYVRKSININFYF